MAKLNSVQKDTTWGKQVEILNDNFNKLNQEVTSAKNKASMDKGYFLTVAYLQVAYPSPTVGMYANVAGIIYSCSTTGIWASTGVSASYDVDLTGVVKIEDLLQTTSDDNEAVMSAKAVTDALELHSSTWDGGTASSTYGGTRTLYCGGAADE